MRFSWRTLVALVCLSLVFTITLGWYLHQRRSEQERLHRQLSWSLRQGDQIELLSDTESAYLDGRYAEALRLLGQPTEASQRELESTLFLCLIFDLPWPQQVVQHEQLEASNSGRSRLLARAVDNGFAGDKKRLRVDLLAWNGQELESLKPVTTAVQSLREGEEWLEIDPFKVVHLERKDGQLGQLWVEGRTTLGRTRVEVIFGLSKWKRWQLVDSKPPRRVSDRVVLSDGRAFKLVDDEWVEVR